MLAGIKSPADLKRLVRRILAEELSVYETEKEIARHRQPRKSNTGGTKETMPGDVHIHHVEQHLQELLGAKVRIRQGRSKGVIEIEFYDREDLERVVESMATLRS